MKSTERAPLTYDALSIKLETARTPFSLYPLLFSGGAAMDRRNAKLHRFEEEIPKHRLQLVLAIYEELLAMRVAGRPDKTLSNYLYQIKHIFTWMDQTDRTPSLSSLKKDYVLFTEYLLHRNKVQKNLSDSSTFAIASSLSAVLDGVLDLKQGILKHTRIRKPRGTAPWGKSDTAELDSDAQEMGRALTSICSALTLDVISGSTPITINVGESKTISAGVRTKKGRIPLLGNGDPDLTSLFKSRRTLLNLRIEAEMLIFISQTGMNLNQVRSLKTGSFLFKTTRGMTSSTDVFKGYKQRRGGEVEFEIFSAYKKHFVEYLSFRHSLFSDDRSDEPLFKFVTPPGTVRPPYYEINAVKSKFLAANVPYKSPRQLRCIRQNWLLEKTGDPLLVADIGQHSPEVLLSNYARPNIKSSLREVARFHQQHDPSATPPGPGACSDHSPKKIEGQPSFSPSPDCQSPSGCLFCVNQRDIDSFDHIWSLLSFRHLKSIELSKYRGSSPATHPAHAAIKRISEKEEEFKADSEQRRIWASDAEIRTQEGWFHPIWENFIEHAEETV